jgi:hypothetical protein
MKKLALVMADSKRHPGWLILNVLQVGWYILKFLELKAPQII